MKYFKDNKFKASAVVAAAVIISGCVSTGSDSTSDGSVADSSKVTQKSTQQARTYIAEAGLTPRQRFTKSLEYLEFGEDGQALAELNEYILAVPRSSSARNLIEQITTDPADYFPAEYFEVDLTSGASLSTLSKKYLGSALKFYALAKYNDIANPSRVNIGQKIKIPLTQLAKAKRQAELEEPNVDLAQGMQDGVTDLVVEGEEAKASLEDAAAESAKALEEQANDTVDDVSDAAADIAAEAEEMVPEVEVTAESVLNELTEFNQSGDYEAAVASIEQLKQFGSLSKETREIALSVFEGRAQQLMDSDATQAASFFSEAGKLNLADGDSFAAFENFKKASDLDVSNEQAMEEMLVLQKDITDKYHREASSAFRRQELDDAIAKWDIVLAVNPDHSSAQLYRAQAIELKERLEKFNSN